MELLLKLEENETAELCAAAANVYPALGKFFCDEIEIRSPLELKFHKTDDEIYLSISEDVFKMVIRKISSIISTFKILSHMANDSLADIADRVGDVDVLINGAFLEDLIKDDMADEGSKNKAYSKDTQSISVFHGV